MIFHSLTISGFGVFADESLEDLSPALNVLEGPNEAGKSTTVEFIRSLLFGFQTGKGARRHPPLRGGAHGGSALIRDGRGRDLRWELAAGGGAGGRITIREIGGAEVERTSLLAGADRGLFTNIFAFSLEEMVGFKELQAGDVEAKIYGAASGTGGSSLLAAAKNVGAQLDGLYTFGGSTRVINKLMRERSELESRIKALRGSLQHYNESKARWEEASAELEAVREEERRARQAAARAEVLSQAWEPWLDLVDCRSRLAALPDPGDMPADAETRLQACLDAIQQRREALQAQRDAREELDRVLEGLDVDQRLLAERSALRDLAEGRTQYIDARADLPKVEALSANAAAKAAESLALLGPDWAEERLRALDRSLSPRGDIDRFRKSLSQAVAAVQAETERLQTATLEVERRRKQAEQAQSQLAEKFPAEPPAIPDYAARRSALEAAEEALRHLELQLAERRHQQERLEEARRHLEERRADLRRQEENARGEAALIGVMPGAWIGVVIAVVCLGLAFAARDNLTLAIGIVALGLAAAVAWVLFASAESQRREKSRARLVNQADALKQQVEALPTLTEPASEPPSPVPSAVLALASFGLRCKSIADTRDELRRLTSAVALRRDFEAAKLEPQAQQREHGKAVELLEACKVRLQPLEEELASLRRQWKSWLIARGLPRETEPETALRLFDTADRAAEFFHARDDADSRLRLIRATLEKFEAGVRAIHKRLDLPAPLAEEIVAAHRSLHERADAQWERVRAREEKNTQRATALAAEKRTADALEEQKAALAALLKAGGATDSDDYRHLARQAAAARQLQSERRELERTLEGLSGPGDLRLTLEVELAQLDQQTVSERRQETAEALEVIVVRRDALIDHLGGLKTLLGQLEQEDALTGLGRELAAKEAELAEASEQWAVLRLTSWLLERTRKKFETERQPAVIRSAGGLMSRLTAGRYTNIVAPEGLMDIELETPAGERKKLEAWSRGTREQLYLALRFAFVQDYSSHSEPLPIIMDDVLVHADGYQRRRLAAETIAEVAQGCQVLYFTCHPDHAALLAESCPGAHRYRVENARFSRVA